MAHLILGALTPALWWRFTWRVTLGELVGLGASLSLMGLPLLWVTDPYDAVEVTTILLLAGLGGAVEGAVLGVAQLAPLRERVPALRPGAWIAATAGTAAVCWLLGMLPSTLLSMAAPASDVAAPTEAPPVDLVWELVQLGLAGVMGTVLGVVLASGQALVLGRVARGAGWWLLAHAVAWGIGMIWIFAVMAIFGPTRLMVPVGIPLAAGGAGLLVGAVSGLGLGRIRGR